MIRLRALKYSAVFVLPLLAVISFYSTGIFTFLPVFYAFAFIPLIEWFTGSDSTNLSKAQTELVKKDPFYDVLLYLTVPVQWTCLLLFLFSLDDKGLNATDLTGRTFSMGILCGVLGINVAHELGHRTTRVEQWLAKTMLLSSLYMHFFIEHNKGHHRNVGTDDDPATAKINESIYGFYLRTISGSFKSAWDITCKELKRKKIKTISLKNEMLVMLLTELALCLIILLFFGISSMFMFLSSALLGILLLETVNYIEHYGLTRKKLNEYRYEDVQPKHSWNSDHIIGRIVLFELTRHSDHHKDPAKHYQVLETMDDALQLPTGYPSMMLLSLIPPVWFRVMNPRIETTASVKRTNNPD